MSHLLNHLYTSESVSIGHPDKIADQISDTILDAYLQLDPEAKVACETLISHNLCVLAGEISARGHLDIAETICKEMPELASFTYVTTSKRSLQILQEPLLLEQATKQPSMAMLQTKLRS